MIAQRWADVAAGCICSWTAVAAGWQRTGPNPRCLAVHELEDVVDGAEVVRRAAWWRRFLAERRAYFAAQERCRCQWTGEDGPYSVPHTIRNPACPEHGGQR